MPSPHSKTKLTAIQDVECNRYNPDKKYQGMFVKTPKKKAAKVSSLPSFRSDVLTTSSG